ncbi:DUF3558 family protein [Actinoalloteichus fjordicus]|uniref:DUF3558 family protein n=1 Tax=Actinoalloteichus fjordicus TaxID=1612552 RepID=A0AAC9PQC7_9PSEU|nr:DUF3558 family protein [Actinoalloteichus fjordicus]APU12979.1 putative DUF3558 family protein [Actinoalloteichus fjordicus]
MTNRTAGITAALLTAALLTITGCTTEVTGQPATPTTTNTTPHLPPPPQHIDLNPITDPCTLLTPEQQDELQFDWEPTIMDDYGQDETSACRFAKNQFAPRHSVVVALAPSVPADRLIGSPNTHTEITDVNGFPAVLNHLMADADDLDCFIEVSTAPGQSLGLQFSDRESGLESNCDNVQRAASMAMDTLIQLHGN